MAEPCRSCAGGDSLQLAYQGEVDHSRLPTFLQGWAILRQSISVKASAGHFFCTSGVNPPAHTCPPSSMALLLLQAEPAAPLDFFVPRLVVLNLWVGTAWGLLNDPFTGVIDPKTMGNIR